MMKANLFVFKIENLDLDLDLNGRRYRCTSERTAARCFRKTKTSDEVPTKKQEGVISHADNPAKKKQENNQDARPARRARFDIKVSC